MFVYRGISSAGTTAECQTDGLDEFSGRRSCARKLPHQ
jgi:hypothetical protein